MNFQEWLSLHEGPPVNMAVQQGEHKFELKAALSQYAPMLKEWGRKMSKATVSFQQDLASLKSLLAEFTNELLNPLEQVLRKGAASRSEPGPHFNFEITDGTSTTTLYSEANGRNAQYYANGSSGGTTNITGPIWSDSDNRLTVTGSDVTGKTSFGTGPCAMNCNNLQGDIYSFHTNGANVVFVDGHVQFISQTINITTLASLVTKGGGEVVDPNAY